MIDFQPSYCGKEIQSQAANTHFSHELNHRLLFFFTRVQYLLFILILDFMDFIIFRTSVRNQASFKVTVKGLDSASKLKMLFEEVYS